MTAEEAIRSGKDEWVGWYKKPFKVGLWGSAKKRHVLTAPLKGAGGTKGPESQRLSWLEGDRIRAEIVGEKLSKKQER